MDETLDVRICFLSARSPLVYIFHDEPLAIVSSIVTPRHSFLLCSHKMAARQNGAKTIRCVKGCDLGQDISDSNWYSRSSSLFSSLSNANVHKDIESQRRKSFSRTCPIFDPIGTMCPCRLVGFDLQMLYLRCLTFP